MQSDKTLNRLLTIAKNTKIGQADMIIVEIINAKSVVYL